MLFMLLSVGKPTETHATFWIDELGDCASNFADSAHYTNDLYNYGLIDLTERNRQLDQEANTHTGCITPINTPTAEPDFCAEARSARDICVAQLGETGGGVYGLSFYGAYSECIQKSGIDQCQ
jgi:hypothetical protein